MRHLPIPFFAGIAALGFAAGGAALAAPPRPAPVFNWTGFYVGGNIGYAWDRLDSNTALTGVGTPSTFGPFAFSHSDSLKFSSAVGGAQIGYNWQTSPNWIYGLEADWQASGAKTGHATSDPYSGSRLGFTATGTANTNYDTKILWFGTVRGRVGYAADGLLVYATTGIAYGQVKLGGTITDSGSTLVIAPPFIPTPFRGTSSFSASSVNAGWTAGAGVERALAPDWTWKAEYLYVDLGSLNLAAPGPFAAAIKVHARFTDNILRIGINRQFGD